MAAGIAQLRIKLDDVEPAVLRRIDVPLTIRLDRLHLVLQAAMGWTNSHLYEFRARDIGWGAPDRTSAPLDAAGAPKPLTKMSGSDKPPKLAKASPSGQFGL